MVVGDVTSKTLALVGGGFRGGINHVLTLWEKRLTTERKGNTKKTRQDGQDFLQD